MQRTYRKVRALNFAETIREACAIVEENIPKIADNQILIKNKYAGINGFFDRAIVRNEMPYRFLQPPLDIGVEAIGTVIEVGKNVKTLKEGDCVSTTKFGQGYREYQVEDSEKVWKILSLTPQYIALRPTAVSALVALEQVGQMRTGETVAVSAAAGGLGQFVVQFAKRAGNTVIGICGSEHKAAFLKTLDCDCIIDYTKEDVNTVLKTQFPNGINLIYDTVGGDLFDIFVSNLAVRGRLIVSGYAADMGQKDMPIAISRPRIYEQIYWKAAQIRAFQNALYPECQDNASRRILEWFENGDIKVQLDSMKFKGIDSIFDAIDYYCKGQNIGKVYIEF
jgi:NADPH-dependent curcumin reductase CurA